MPEYTFTGLIQHHYPATRDARGIHLQLVDPGDIRDLEQPPDRQWRETTDEDRAAAAAKAAEPAKASPEEDASEEAAEDEPGAGTGASDPPAITPPPGPVPAPPAVIPGVQPSTAGVTGSEE